MCSSNSAGKITKPYYSTCTASSSGSLLEALKCWSIDELLIIALFPPPPPFLSVPIPNFSIFTWLLARFLADIFSSWNCGFFWCYSRLQVMAILCCVAKNSLRSTRTCKLNNHLQLSSISGQCTSVGAVKNKSTIIIWSLNLHLLYKKCAAVVLPSSNVKATFIKDCLLSFSY